MRGAGGTSGGAGRFFIGLFMMIGGGYLFLDSVHVGWHFGHGFYRFGGFNVTSGMILIPLIIGVLFIFYNAKNPIGWIIAAGSLLAFIFGVIKSLQFHMERMSAFSLILILVLLFGGVGLFISSLKDFSGD